jgi:CheY-like chemotaxis protein
MILLVDDDADDLDLFQEVLDKSGYPGKSVQLNNGQELMTQLDRITKPQVQLIVLDLNMPVKNGFEVLQEIKADNALRSIPVIILSASSSKKDEERCIALGCNMFFRKPNSIQGYNELIARILEFLNQAKK